MDQSTDPWSLLVDDWLVIMVHGKLHVVDDVFCQPACSQYCVPLTFTNLPGNCKCKEGRLETEHVRVSCD